MSRTPNDRPEEGQGPGAARPARADRRGDGEAAETTLAAAVDRRQDEAEFKSRLQRILDEDAELLRRLAK